MDAITFPLSASCKEASNRLNGLAYRMGPLTRGETLLVDSVRRALASGLFYTREVLAFVVHDLKVSAEGQALNDKTRVEGGVIGMEAYYARDYLRAIAEREENEAAAGRIMPFAGKKLGAIVLNDGKLINACFIVKMSQNGCAITFQGKRGRNLVEWTGETSSVERGMLRAMEEKAQRAARRAAR